MKFQHFLCKTMLVLVLTASLNEYSYSSAQADNPRATTAFEDLEIFHVGYPRVIQFREAEYEIQQDRLPYEEWARRTARVNGMVGKALQETQLLRDGGIHHIDYYTRFKKEHPEKIVIIHHNDMAKLPVPWRALDGYWDGHWLYNEGTTMTKPIEATNESTVIHVEDVTGPNPRRPIFRDGLHYPNTAYDEVGIARTGEDGKPDWNRAEHVQITAIDRENNTITVNRAMYDSEALDWPAGSYLAAHPGFGARTNKRWWFNLSTHAPYADDGRQGMDAFVDDLVGSFGPGGPLEVVDAVQFDVARFEVATGAHENSDFTGDGVADGGLIDNVNTYGKGKMEFYKKLREALPEKMILADHHDDARGAQRGFNILNGIESEGWPRHNDYNFDWWSQGLNRHFFWNQNSVGPVFNYMVHKFNALRDEKPSAVERQFSIQRLLTAAAVITDAAITVRYLPNYGDLYDELQKGAEEEVNWMGMPKGKPVSMAARAPDLLEGEGLTWGPGVMERLHGQNVSFKVINEQLLITPDTQSGPYRIRNGRFTLRGIENDHHDLFVTLTLRGLPIQGYQETIGRKVQVWAENRNTGESLESFSWMNQKSFDATFYFRDIAEGTIDLTFEVEGDPPFYFENMTVHAATDAIYRDFDHGVVFANPSTVEYTFQVDELFPNDHLRRLKGIVSPDVNTGEPIGSTVTIGPRDALFVTKYDPTETSVEP